MARQDLAVRTVWDVLFAPGDRRLGRWRDRLGGPELPARLASRAPGMPTGVAAVVRRQLAEAVQHALTEHRLVDELCGVWASYVDVQQAAERTVAVPGSMETVPLASERLPSRHEVLIDVLVNDAKVTTVRAVVDLELLIEAVLVEIAGGAVVALSAGRSSAKATMSVADVDVLSRRCDIDLSTLLRNETNFPLVQRQIRLPGQLTMDPDDARR